jgi:hypothetical protein
LSELYGNYLKIKKVYSHSIFCSGSTAFGWGAAAGATFLYLTDWKLVMQYVPFVNKKFDHEIPQ